jgi:cytoskeleton protein RodZ
MTVVAQAESAGPSETEPSDILPSDTLPSDTLPSGPGPEAAVTTAAAEPAFPVPVAPDVTTAVAAAPSSPSVAPSPVALSSDDADGAPAPQASAPEQPAEQQTGGTQTAVLPPAVPAEPPAPPAVPAAQALPTGGKVYGIVNGSSRIQLHATQDSWVEVRNAAGDLLFARLLRPGDLYRVSDEAGLRLVTGNAGGIVVVVDGVAAAAPMGQAGQVLRDVALDPARLAGR